MLLITMLQRFLSIGFLSIVCIFLLSSNNCFGQSDTVYLDQNAKKIKSSKKAAFKRVVNNDYSTTDYTMDGHLYMKVESISPKEIIEGKCTYYFKNGNKKMEGYFRNDIMVGHWTYWTEDHSDSSLAQFNAHGKMISNSGEEKAKATLDSNYAAIKNKIHVDSLSVTSNAYYPGGALQMSKFMKANIKYPREAERRRISGKVVVYFEVDKEGNVCNIEALYDIGFGMADEAVRVVSIMPKWVPASIDGRNVRQRMIIPILFILPEWN